MIWSWIRKLAASAGKPAGAVSVPATAEQAADLAARLQELNRTPYICVADAGLRLISVFDDVCYDRADMDSLSGAMREHAAQKLGPLGFAQTSGSSFVHEESGIRVLMPKSHALGASPFDIARYTPRGTYDYYLLTPTQSAAMMIDGYATEDAFERIAALIRRQPINILRLADYLERKPEHDAFREEMGKLRYLQREAVAAEPLRRRRALGTMGI
ncbi:hypothetical protein [Cribrihabitans neustonicus]|uniref:hypothetical protein n=1 Tax=Cribrihabitans neustonicus TaxID=1429085 RepID=UPI003B5C63A0